MAATIAILQLLHPAAAMCQYRSTIQRAARDVIAYDLTFGLGFGSRVLVEKRQD